MPAAKHDIFDFIVSPSQLVYKYLFKRQRHGVHKQGVRRGKPLAYLVRIAAQNQLLKPPHRGAVQDVQPVGQRAAVGEGKLNLHKLVLKLVQPLFEQHPAVLHNPDVVAHVLQLAQVVRGDEHGRAVFADVVHQLAPDLTPHHGVKPVHRLVEDEYFRPCGQRQPECGLLLHTL